MDECSEHADFRRPGPGLGALQGFVVQHLFTSEVVFVSRILIANECEIALHKFSRVESEKSQV